MFPAFQSGDAFIPSLPDALQRVPGYRVDPLTGEEDPTWRTEWFAWRDAVRDHRVAMQERCFTDETLRADIKRLCADDPAYFVTMWLVVEEPRVTSIDNNDSDMVMEYIPFAYQVKLIQLFAEVTASSQKLDVYISKARGIGVSYTMLAAAYWAFLFRPWRGRFLSEKLEKADRSMDLDSLFGKVDLYFEHTPHWLRPPGFNAKSTKHRQQGMFKNPATRGQMTAEATTSRSGRGGRATYICNDEAAFQQNFSATHATIGGTTKHRFTWSTESYEMGYQWQTAWHSAKEAEQLARDNDRPPVALVIELNWYENPYQDRAWYDEEYARYEAAGMAQEFGVEYLRNPDMGYSTFIYPGVRENVPNVHIKQDESGRVIDDGWYMPDRMLCFSVDNGVEDDTAIVFWQNYFPNGNKRLRWIDSYSRNKMPAEFYAHVMTGIMPHQGDVLWDPDHDYEALFGPKERYFMEWLKTIDPGMIVGYGDPSVGANVGGIIRHKPNSFATRFNEQTRKCREHAGIEPARPIDIYYKELHTRNRHNQRRTSMRAALVYSEFSLTDGAQDLKEAIAKVRLQEGTEKTTSPPGWIHDRYTHLTSAAEFGMVYEDLKLTVQEVMPARIKQIGRMVRSGARNPRKVTPYTERKMRGAA